MSESLSSPHITTTRDHLRPYWPAIETLDLHHRGRASLVFCNSAEGYVVKVPRTLNWRCLVALEHEAEVLEVLADAPNPPVAVPRLLEYGLEHAYMVSSFIPNEAPRDCYFEYDWADQDLMVIAEKLAEFIHWFSEAVRPQFYGTRLRHHTPSYARRGALNGLYWSSENSLEHTGAPCLDRLIVAVKRDWHDFNPQRGDEFFGHNDLHFRNMAFLRDAAGWQLNGVFDFGIAQPSSPAQEMRYLYGVSPAAAEVCAQRYEQLSGMPVNRASLRLWGTAEYALRMRYILRYSAPPEHFRIGKIALERMYPETDWSQLDEVYMGSAGT